MNITLRQLRAFREVARTQSFTAAARRLNLTQSAVSMLVRQLERELGMVLFNRYQRAAALTDIGQSMMPVTDRIIEDLRQIEEGANSLRMLARGKLQLAVPQILACSWLPPIISRFRALYPEVIVTVTDTTGDHIVNAVLQNEAELGIGPARPTPPGVESRLLWQEEMQLVCASGSALAEQAHVSWRDLHKEKWIHYSDDLSLHLERSAWSDFHASPTHTMNVRYLSTALAFVGQGLGVTAAPQYAREFGRLFPVRFVSADEPVIYRHFFIYTRRGQQLSPAAAAFAALLSAIHPEAEAAPGQRA